MSAENCRSKCVLCPRKSQKETIRNLDLESHLMYSQFLMTSMVLPSTILYLSCAPVSGKSGFQPMLLVDGDMYFVFLDDCKLELDLGSEWVQPGIEQIEAAYAIYFSHPDQIYVSMGMMIHLVQSNKALRFLFAGPNQSQPSWLSWVSIEKI